MFRPNDENDITLSIVNHKIVFICHANGVRFLCQGDMLISILLTSFITKL
ncbi:MAG: hypothetical protein EZS28_038739, partial [Streblomastix strix]